LVEFDAEKKCSSSWQRRWRRWTVVTVTKWSGLRIPEKWPKISSREVSGKACYVLQHKVGPTVSNIGHCWLLCPWPCRKGRGADFRSLGLAWWWHEKNWGNW
jgi:hypothetical protein